MKFQVKWKTNLGGVLYATIGDPEGVDCPIQVKSLFGFSKRQTLSQSSLIDLDNSDAILLKILHFILNGQSNLVAGLKSEKKENESLIETMKYKMTFSLSCSFYFQYLGWSFRTKDQLSMVTGPVSIPFIGREVML
jgi:hypothetical protein